MNIDLMKMNCAQIGDELTAYHHRELSVLARVLVRWHLSYCAHCRKEMTIMQHISATLQESETASGDKVLDAALRAKILARVPESSAPVAPLAARRAPLAAWGVLAATACVAAAIFFPVFSRSKENARRASAQSNLKQIGLGLAQYAASESVADSSARIAVRGSLPSSVTRSVNPNYDFVDGHAKWLRPQDKALQLQQNQITKSQIYPSAAGATSTPLTPYRRVHREGSISVDVENLERDSDAVESVIQKAGGFVANNTLSTQADGLKTAALEVRVPVGQFETVIKQITALGEVKAKRVQGEDITAQVSDADQENNVVANDLRVRLDQYRQVKARAASKNKSVPDDWQRRTEIRQMRVQLAQVRARIEYLKKLSDFAALSVELREKPTGANASGGFLNDIGNTGHDALDSFVLAARLPINLLIYLLVYSPFWLPVLLAWRYFLRSNRAPAP